MHELSVAFVWHQHQPYYPDDVAGQNPMPWVRLHGTKDYWGMAAHLDEVPEVHATINFVPSLLAQIVAYTDGNAQDEHLRVSRLPADSLNETDRLYVLENFFLAHPDHMIRPYARYYELYELRALGRDDAARALRRFSDQDLRDLQCWNNLVWFHPIAFERNKELREFRRKGQRWNESEKQWLLDQQMKLLGQVIPLHRKLAQRGQLELTTTPFYHPILPLLIDKRLARQAMPQVELPRHLESYADDAARQVVRAVEYHTQVFGQAPVGMWPAEGSVAQAIIAPVAKAGIEWIASDEEILSRSTDGWIARDAQGLVQHAEKLYRPWRVEENGQRLQMIFRDHTLSDHIGFHYQRYGSEQAVDDLIGRFEVIGRECDVQAAGSSPLVSIILDGDNCWEYYPDGGLAFLRGLYQRLASHPHFRPVCVRDYLRQHPATETLGHLFAGSWINHDFAIWIGHPACNRAWDLLAETRALLVKRAAAKDCPADDVARAWKELEIAEGSDWFWWFDEHHSSSQDWLFDQLFRKHLQNVYTLLGEEPPAKLQSPIGLERQVRPFTQPTGLLDVKVNGRETYFEWINAGVYLVSAARGTMTMADAERIEHLCFGFDTQRLLLRLDSHGSIRQRLADVDTLRITFLEPEGFQLVIARPGDAKPTARLLRGGARATAPGIEVATDTILEIALPWQSLAEAAGAPLHFYAELLANDQPLERVPREGAIETCIPSPDYELMMWQA